MSNNAGGVLGGISHRPGPHGLHRDQADQLDPQPAPLDRPRRQADRGRDPRPARPLRRHPRRADRRGAARAGGDGPRAAASGAVRRRARRHPADPGPRALMASSRRSGPRHEHATAPAPFPHPAAADPRRGGLSRPAADGQADPALVLARPDDAKRARDERIVRLDRRRHRRPRGRPAGGALQPRDEGRAPDRDRTVLRQPPGAAHRELSARTRLRGGARGLVAALSADADRGRTGSRGHAQRRRHRVRRRPRAGAGLQLHRQAQPGHAPIPRDPHRRARRRDRADHRRRRAAQLEGLGLRGTGPAARRGPDPPDRRGGRAGAVRRRPAAAASRSRGRVQALARPRGGVGRRSAAPAAGHAPARRRDDRRLEPRALHPRQAADGAVVVRRPASGLVTAVEPVMRACSGTWIAHGSGIGRPRDASTPHDRIACPAGRARLHASAPLAHAAGGSRATTTASPTRASGRFAMSPTSGRCSAKATGSSTAR